MTETPEEAPATDFSPKLVWTWEEYRNGGYASKTRLEVGQFTHIEDAPLLPQFSSPEAITGSCQVDPLTDAVAPASVTMTNTTKGFPSELSASFSLPPGSSSQNLTEMQVAAAYSAGIECHDIGPLGTGTPWSIKWTTKADPGTSTQPSYAYLIITGYFSPNHPDGDTTITDRAILDLGRFGDFDTKIKGLRGPGLARDRDGAPIPFLPLSGKQPCKLSTSNGIGNPVYQC